MSVRVNLLPREDRAAKAARRTTNLTVLGVALFALLLGGLYLMKLNEIAQAEADQETVQADVSRLQAEVASLEQFRQLADELEARNALLASAMGREISFARVMNDMSLAFPANSSLRSMTLAAADPALVATADTVAFGETVATVSYEGYSVERFAPGVETVILEFDKVRAFFNAFIGTAAVEEIGTTEVTGYQGTVGLDDAALTGRYANGLPEEASR
jgi:hypothetical protein